MAKIVNIPQDSVDHSVQEGKFRVILNLQILQFPAYKSHHGHTITTLTSSESISTIMTWICYYIQSPTW